jgi:hypothetical protein
VAAGGGVTGEMAAALALTQRQKQWRSRRQKAVVKEN